MRQKGLGFRVQGLGFRVPEAENIVPRVWGLGLGFCLQKGSEELLIAFPYGPLSLTVLTPQKPSIKAPKVAPFGQLSCRIQFFVVLYCNFRSFAFLGLLGFPRKAAKTLIHSYPPKCSQEFPPHPCPIQEPGAAPRVPDKRETLNPKP